VLQRVAVYQMTSLKELVRPCGCASFSICVAVVLQSAAACCSVLQGDLFVGACEAL